MNTTRIHSTPRTLLLRSRDFYKSVAVAPSCGKIWLDFVRKTARYSDGNHLEFGDTSLQVVFHESLHALDRMRGSSSVKNTKTTFD